MNNKGVTDNYDNVIDILQKLGLFDDEDLRRDLSLVQIEIDGASVNHSDVTAKQALQLESLHLKQIHTSLHAIVRSALGYYALAEQPIGTNEPPIGPSDAITLLNKFEDQKAYPHHDINQLKDEIFRSLASNQVDEHRE